MGKRVCVIGLGSFGKNVAMQLAELGVEVTAIDSDAEAVENMSKKVSRSIAVDFGDQAFLDYLDSGQFDAMVVALPDVIMASMIAVLACGKGPHIIAWVDDDRQMRLFRRIGVDQIIFPNRESGIRTALQLADQLGRSG